MKNILTTIGNLFLFILVTIKNLIQIIWFGKLPKVSIYHQSRYIFNAEDIFNYINAQVNHVSNPNKYNL